MIDRVIGNGMLPASIRQEIIERTDGIPLFVEEMTKAILRFRGIPGSARCIGNSIYADGCPRDPPCNFNGPSRSPRPCKGNGEIGAVIGRQFSYELLAAVAGFDAKTLGGALDRLADAGLVFQQGSLPNASFLFKHALVQEAACATSARGPRQNLHAQF